MTIPVELHILQLGIANVNNKPKIQHEKLAAKIVNIKHKTSVVSLFHGYLCQWHDAANICNINTKRQIDVANILYPT